MSATSRRRRSGASPSKLVARGLAALLVAAGAACNSSTDPEVKPSQAEIRITGTATEPLRLVVSTDFVETINQGTGTRAQVFNTADTVMITSLPYTETVTLTDLGSVVVDLSNQTDVVATVRLFVELDGGQPPYEQEAMMSAGGALRYVFAYFSPVFI